MEVPKWFLRSKSDMERKGIKPLFLQQRRSFSTTSFRTSALMDLCCIFLSYKWQRKLKQGVKLLINLMRWEFPNSSGTFAGHLFLSVVTMNNVSTGHTVIPPTGETISRKIISSFKTQLELEEDPEGFPLNPLWLKAKINPFVWHDCSAELSTTWKIYHSELMDETRWETSKILLEIFSGQDK